jgi:inorganic pyrophosphatase
VSLYELPPGASAPELVNVVVEIPKGSRNKVEFDPELGVFRVDRVLYSPIHYPGDYGFIPGTLSPDGDALDVLVLVTEPTFTGCVLAARPIGVLEMSDEAGTDEKILAVPQRDPRFDEVRSLSDLPAHLVKEVEYFFEVYKELEGKETAVLGWDDLDSAHAIIRRSIEAFREKS